MNHNKFKLLKVSFIDSQRAWGFCVFHNDNQRPNLSITLTDDYYGRYKCWTCNVCGYLSTEQMNKLNLSKKKRREPMNIDWDRLVIEYRENLNYKYPEKIKELAELWNIDPIGLWVAECGWDLEAYTFPMHDGHKNVIGIQRRWLNPVKGGKCCVEGSRLGLFCTRDGLSEPLFITEGVSDMLSVNDLNFCVIGKPNCEYGDSIILDFIKYYGFENVIIVPDDDEVGRKGATKLMQTIRSNTTVDVVWFVFSGVKDIREYIAKFGKEQVTKELNDIL